MSGVRVERQGRVATLRLDKARGNAIDEPFTNELLAAVRELDADDGVRAVLLASAHPKLFSPGLDLVTLLEYDRASMQRFMGVFGDAVLALYGLRKPVVAALAGHAVAGGCILALTADLRVLRRGGVQIGLNEVKVGVPLPWEIAALLAATVGPRSLTQVALLGRNFADEEAVAVGLVDALADTDGFEDTCRARLDEFLDKDQTALAVTKRYLRHDALQAMSARSDARYAEWLDCWFSETTRERIRKTVASLAKK